MLTPTQVDILKHLARDESYDTVAEKLDMTPNGVRYHLARIRDLLHINGVPAIIALAIVAGILTYNQWPVESTGELFIDL
ncbi:LuxR C-terminal-related transcriptional regulator [Frondihabitans sp. PhB188]|uniref:helix-turn-helix transcriptional regulator n=1 Tax=Frondihabitans sp. PhB188 TaxID=2485200 RepID=UPI00131593F3|nr:LuxR C-terminal-related transcriptional regulator [Frondihabitans sp. PhB188]